MKKTDRYPLKTLFWECTKRCNACCSFCGSSCGGGAVFENELTQEEICAALRDIAQKLPAREIMINVTGGEPLLRRDVFEVMEEAVSLGFSWGMVSNGSLITDEVIARMEQAHMKTLTVSIDGCAKTHESLRRLPGSFERIIEALQKLHRAGFLDHLQVTTVVNRQNLHELEELREILLGVGLDSWRVVTVDPIGRAKNSELLLDREGLMAYMAFVRKYRFDERLPVINSCSHYFGEWEGDLRSGTFSCGAGTRVASILYNGDIFVCPNVEHRPELIEGNVRTVSLADAWTNGFSFYRNPSRCRSEQCKTCYHFPSCKGDSLHTWDHDAHKPRFCIRSFYDLEHDPAFFAAEALYNTAVQEVKTVCGSPASLCVFPEIPAKARVVFTPRAVEELTSFFEWDSESERNRMEQMAALIGRRAGSLYVVDAVREVYLPFRDEQTAVFTRDTLHSAFDQLSSLRESSPDPALLGFVHSHPNELKTMLSVADVELHRYLTAEMEIALSMLVNPQKCCLRVFEGEKPSLSEVFFFGEAQRLSALRINER